MPRELETLWGQRVPFAVATPALGVEGRIWQDGVPIIGILKGEMGHRVLVQ